MSDMGTSLAAFVWFSTVSAGVLGIIGWILAFDEREPGAGFVATLFLLYAAWGAYLIYNS